jgi:multidrug efflux pump subunit AcrB
MLVVPLGVIGALLAATFRGLTNDVYFQVGLLTTIGLSAKNAILIVEFAKDLMEKEGKGLIEATLDAVRMRLRPILMTSLAFILGVMPLVISSGAGSGAQNAVGTGVMGAWSPRPFSLSSSYRCSLWWFAAALAARVTISSIITR